MRPNQLTYTIRLAAIVTLCLLLQNTQAQNWTLRGQITSESGEGLAGALVQINDSTGTTTDGEGRFLIQTNQRPNMVLARYLGYFPRRLQIREQDWKNQAIQLQIALTSQTTMLSEVSVSAKRQETIVAEDFQTDIFDYEFAGDNILLLLRERKQYYIRLVNEQGAKLSELRVDGHPPVLHRSCTGSLHLVGGEFAQELTLNGLQLDTFPRYALYKFKKLIAPCVQESKGYYFFKSIGPFNQSLTYVYFDPEHKRHLLTHIVDEAGDKRAREAYFDFVNGAPLFIQHGKAPSANEGFNLFDVPEDENKALDNDDFSFEALSQFADGYEGFAHLTWLEVLRKDSVYAPLIKLHDTLYLFDHVNDRLFRFNSSFKGSDVSPIRYHHNGNGWTWQKDLLSDAQKGHVYARFAKGDKYLLQRVDLKTGAGKEMYPLDEVFSFAGNFKVRNGILYYLGRPDNNIPNAHLFRVKLVAERGQ